MGMEFRGYDDNNVPIYVYVPDESDTVNPTPITKLPEKSIDTQLKPVTDVADPSPSYSDFCTARGGTVSGSDCNLPSGVICGLQEYYLGTCGENKIPPAVAVGALIIIGILAAAVLLN